MAKGMEVAARAELHDDAGQVQGRVEVGEERGEEGVVEQPYDALLGCRALQVLLLGHRPSIHHLHRVKGISFPCAMGGGEEGNLLYSYELKRVKQMKNDKYADRAK